MARVPSKHGRDEALDFQGFLNDLQDWELSLKDKDKKMKPQAPQKGKLASSQGTGKTTPVDYSRSSRREFDYNGKYGENPMSSSFMTEENMPDANSEKELALGATMLVSMMLTMKSIPILKGNECFKKKNFKEAIECYSRSIALSPTAVAYANRAMAYLKIRRFQEAEEDCTEALNLDDRYIKAYSRRATARKELGKYKGCFEDAEFALRLEPQNQEVKKQYTEARSLYNKGIVSAKLAPYFIFLTPCNSDRFNEILEKVTGPVRNSTEGMEKVGSSESEVNGQSVHPVLNTTQGSGVAAVQGHTKDNDGLFPARESAFVEEIESRHVKGGSRIVEQEVNVSHVNTTRSSRVDSVKKNHRTRNQELRTSVQVLASQAASRAKAEAAKNITPPNSAYQFEVSWRGLSGDRALQAVSPTALPQIFKNALSASLLMDIVRCIATFFTEEIDLAVKYVETLTKVSRFDLLIMCLSSTDRDDLRKIWDEVFCSETTPIEYAETLDKLRSKFCPKG
ncbi:RNA polymerase II-associated protein 3 [Morella rubra]|uniref:RNA polymerase II-associated protein 3 n=1 Tax=Morella rubra TaxID=262757 RepID=A0A6A1UPE4_9ROSI|nr:RNA polymerase II-associated protein 3 [Morella rubra]